MGAARHHAWPALIGLAILAAGCSKPAGTNSTPPGPSEAASECPGNADWLDKTAKLEIEEPVNPSKPTDVFECGFYQRSWEGFLLAMRPDPANGKRPAFLGYATYRSIFGGQVSKNFAAGPLGLAIRTPEEAGPIFDGGIIQANSDVVVDQNGNPILYSIEIDPVFAKFITDNQLNNQLHLKDPATHPDLPPGALEIKASWEIVENPKDFDGYLTTQASVPALIADTAHPGKVKIDPTAPPKTVTVALLGIHIVYVLNNHPEMIWATFEHVGLDNVFDLAPPAANLPEKIGDPNQPVAATGNFRLYAPGATYAQSNVIPPALTLAGGKLTPHSSIYRAFPWSQQANPQDSADPLKPDPDVKAVNDDMTRIFAKQQVSDFRSHYRLVGAVWLKEGANRFNAPGTASLNDLAGETGLSNVSIESFTQQAAPSGDVTPSAPNCLSCHVRPGGGILKGKALGVSHLFLKFATSKP